MRKKFPMWKKLANSRGEILRNHSTLWRNGIDHEIEKLVLSPGWSDFHITQLNDAGMMAGFAAKNSGAEQVVLLLPIEFEIIHTEVDPATGNPVNPGKDKVLRDEIVDVRIKIPPLGGNDWTVDLTIEPEAMRTQDLPTRGDVQMYDFGQIEPDGTVTPDKTQFVLKASAGGERTIKAVFNKAGKLKIKMKSTDGKIDFTSPEYTVEERIRKYAMPYPGFPNHDPNQYDKDFVDAVEHWRDFYSHPIDTVDRIKAMAVAESNVGAYVQNPTSRPHDILTIGHPGDQVLATIQGNPAQWDIVPDHPKRPARDARFKQVIYPDASISSPREAIKWGVLWLYVKAFAQAPVASLGVTHWTTERNPIHTPTLVWERRNKPPYDVIEGDEESEFIFVGWHSWDDATKLYNGGGDAANPTKVEHALRRGLHYYNNTTKPIWPIRSNKSARQ